MTDVEASKSDLQVHLHNCTETQSERVFYVTTLNKFMHLVGQHVRLAHDRAT